MLNPHQFESIAIKLQVTDRGRQLIEFARANSPVRRAQQSLGNTIVQFYSNKMGQCLIELESRTVEEAAATLYESDPEVLEYYFQPFEFDIHFNDDNGSSGRYQHTPDCLVITKSGIFVDEWREEGRLFNLSQKSEWFFKDDAGVWRNKRAEQHLFGTGLQYHLRSALEIPRISMLNTRFLADYRSGKYPPLTADQTSRILSELKREHYVPFLALVHQAEIEAGLIFRAIIENVIYVDLHRQRLDEPSSVVLFSSEEHARIHRLLAEEAPQTLPLPGTGLIRVGSRLRYDNKEFEVLFVGSERINIADEFGHTAALKLDHVRALLGKEITIERPAGQLDRSLFDLSKHQLQSGLRKLEILDGAETELSVRTIQRYRASTSGCASITDQVVALADETHLRGNRNIKVSQGCDKLAVQTLDKYYNNKIGPTVFGAFTYFLQDCEALGIHPMSPSAFYARARKHKDIVAREGKRKAYQVEHIPYQYSYHDPIHGMMPHEVVYIDHTIAPLATTGPGGSDLGKPVLTLANDGHTTQARAFFVSYHPPSNFAVLMVLRDYVRRHGRLPRVLVVDGGREFRSKALKLLARLTGITLRFRPGGRPRGGAPIERLLGATEAEVIAQLQGNTRIMRNARMVTGDMNPFQDRCWTLKALHGALDDYLFGYRETIRHPKLNMAPPEFERMRITETGAREHNLCAFDENFLLLTSPHPRKMHHVVDPQRGVWVDGLYYWNDHFKSFSKGASVEVRIEPWKANVIYCQHDREWLVCCVSDLQFAANRTQMEMAIALREERRLGRINAKRDRQSYLSAKRRTSLWRPEAFDERLGEQYREMTFLYSALGMTTALPVPIAPSPLLDVSEPTSNTDRDGIPFMREEMLNGQLGGVLGEITGYY